MPIPKRAYSLYAVAKRACDAKQSHKALFFISLSLSLPFPLHLFSSLFRYMVNSSFLRKRVRGLDCRARVEASPVSEGAAREAGTDRSQVANEVCQSERSALIQLLGFIKNSACNVEDYTSLVSSHFAQRSFAQSQYFSSPLIAFLRFSIDSPGNYQRLQQHEWLVFEYGLSFGDDDRQHYWRPRNVRIHLATWLIRRDFPYLTPSRRSSIKSTWKKLASLDREHRQKVRSTPREMVSRPLFHAPGASARNTS